MYGLIHCIHSTHRRIRCALLALATFSILALTPNTPTYAATAWGSDIKVTSTTVTGTVGDPDRPGPIGVHIYLQDMSKIPLPPPQYHGETTSTPDGKFTYTFSPALPTDNRYLHVYVYVIGVNAEGVPDDENPLIAGLAVNPVNYVHRKILKFCANDQKIVPPGYVLTHVIEDKTNQLCVTRTALPPPEIGFKETIQLTYIYEQTFESDWFLEVCAGSAVPPGFEVVDVSTAPKRCAWPPPYHLWKLKKPPQ